MKLLLRFLALPVLLPFAAAAQLVTGPLPADPARATSAQPAAGAAQRMAALTLPFFEDFTSPQEGAPNATRWQAATASYPNSGSTISYAGGGAYVSNRLAVEPLTRGTATLDGLRGNGLPYAPTVTTSGGQTDTLTSQAIDLSGFSTSSNIYLSFAWQAGSVVGYPANSTSSMPVNLTLEMLDRTGNWQSAWTYTSRGNSTRFKQQIFAVNSAAYLHNAFRFRFRASGSRTDNTDAFGLDYIYLNSNRAANDTTFQDIATSRGLSNPLQPYTSLPVWQYNAAAATAATLPLNPAVTATVNSLTNTGQTPTPISWQGTVRDLAASGFAGTWLTGGRPIVAAARQDVVQGDATTAPLPTTAVAKRLRYQLALQTNETNPLTLPNDTTRRDVELADYYAYDDGTAEYILGLVASNTNPTSYVALAYATSQPDYVKALRVAPVFNNTPTNDNNQSRSIIVAVWGDNNGKPTNLPLATATGTLINPTPSGAFQEIAFTTPVAVSGRFYVGYGQASTGQFLNYGLDLNNQLPANTLFSNTLGAANANPWQAVTLATPGAPMFRPVMAQTYLATRSQQAISAAFSLYPNPVPGGTTVAVEGPAFRQAALLDVLGRTVWQQPAAEAGRATLRLPATLPSGVYVVQLALPDGSTATRRLVIE